MISPLLIASTVAPMHLAMAGATPATLRRYATVSDGVGGTTKTLAETRTVNVRSIEPKDRAARGLAATDTLYLARVAETGVMPAVVSDWTLVMGDSIEQPISSTLDRAGIYIELVVQSGGGPS